MKEFKEIIHKKYNELREINNLPPIDDMNDLDIAISKLFQGVIK